MATPTTNPENMLPIMIVLGVMFIGICIAMNLFSRARFKKRTNAFAVAARASTSNRRSHRGSTTGPGLGQRLDTQVVSRSVSPMLPSSGGTHQTTTTKIAKHYEVPSTDGSSIDTQNQHRTSLAKA